ncbi:MAG: hypothetical protein AAB739_01615 [Patescibacteria group bacterium]
MTDIKKEEAEGEILQETLDRFEQRSDENPCDEDELDESIVTPATSIDEIAKRIKRAGALSPSSPLRIGLRFLRETDPKLN